MDRKFGVSPLRVTSLSCFFFFFSRVLKICFFGWPQLLHDFLQLFYKKRSFFFLSTSLSLSSFFLICYVFHKRRGHATTSANSTVSPQAFFASALFKVFMYFTDFLNMLSSSSSTVFRVSPSVAPLLLFAFWIFPMFTTCLPLVVHHSVGFIVATAAGTVCQCRAAAGTRCCCFVIELLLLHCGFFF